MSSDKVMILLSTYNAQTYLAEQLDSLLAQDYQNVQIMIRDDGSSDDTIEMLKKYAKKDARISYYTGTNKGAKGSFFDLMKHVSKEEFAYLAFCDQDDYWLADKVETAVKQLSGRNEAPLLYCSRTQLVDAKLEPIETQIKRNIRPAFANALIENIVTGCTTVLNRPMYEIMMQYMPDYCIMHDWWMYVVATCFGKVIYDDTPHILYRQHGNNVMGIESDYAAEMKSRAKKYKSRKSNICIQAGELVRLLESNQDAWKNRVAVKEAYEKAKLLADYKKHFGSRIKLAFGKEVYRQRKGDDFIFHVLFLLGVR